MPMQKKSNVLHLVKKWMGWAIVATISVLMILTIVTMVAVRMQGDVNAATETLSFVALGFTTYSLVTLHIKKSGNKNGRYLNVLVSLVLALVAKEYAASILIGMYALLELVYVFEAKKIENKINAQ